MWSKCLIILVISSADLIKSCSVPTFHDTRVTLTGVKGVENVDGCFEPGKNFDRVTVIQIINETVPILYEDAINNLPDLIEIIMRNDYIREIHPNAIRNLPSLYLIKLENNQFEEIREGVFNNLTVSELILTNNGIAKISPRAFDNLPNLSILNLGNNKIKQWESSWFRGSPKITVLNFERNQLEIFPAKALQNIKGRHEISKKLNVSTTIHLNDNSLKTIESGAFEGIQSLGWLFLQRNQLEEIKLDSIKGLEHVDWLRLDHNKLQCVPEKMSKITPNFKYYLDGNPLSDDCKRKFDIRKKPLGTLLDKFYLKIE